MRDDGDDGGVEFLQGCLSGSWNAGSAPVREFWKGGRRKRGQDSGALLTDVLYVCGEEEDEDEKRKDFTWSDRALAGSLSVRPWSSVLAFGVGRSGGVQ